MKKISILLLLSLLVGYSSQAQVKIGVIDAQKVVEKSNKGVEMQKKLELLQKQKQDKLTGMQEEIKALEKDLQSPALTTREEKVRDLESKQIEFKRAYEDAQKELQKITNNSLLDLEKELQPIIQSYAKNNGFTVIYDRERSGIIYFDNAIDVSNEIINILNQQ